MNWKMIGPVLLAVGMPLLAADWTQYRGPDRNGISGETELLRSWGEAGPEELWRVPIGEGFSSITVIGDRIYTMDADSEKEYALSTDAETGETIWRVALDDLFTNNFGDGPRATPTFADGVIYTMASRGTLAALKADNGKVIWKKDIKDFGGEVPTWAFCASPLVIGDQVILEVGGTGERNLASLDRQTGAVRWHALADTQAYSSPIHVRFQGRDLLVGMTKENVFGVDLKGAELWKLPFAPDGSIKPAPPVLVGEDHVFFSASYGIGAKLVRLKLDGETIAAESVWEEKVMHNHFNGSVAHGTLLYGFDKANFKCIDALSREQKWVKRGLGKGSLIMADSLLYVLGERGRLVLVEATPEAYRELGALDVLSGRCWTQPTLSGGRLFLRNGDEMVALAVR